MLANRAVRRLAARRGGPSIGSLRSPLLERDIRIAHQQVREPAAEQPLAVRFRIDHHGARRLREGEGVAMGHVPELLSAENQQKVLVRRMKMFAEPVLIWPPGRVSGYGPPAFAVTIPMAKTAIDTVLKRRAA